MSRTILVTGDAVYDHFSYTGERGTADSPQTRGFRQEATLGGAKLLHDLIVAVLQAAPDASLQAEWSAHFGITFSDPARLPSQYHSYALWKPFPAAEGKGQVWRAADALGYGTPESSSDSNRLGIRNPEAPSAPDILVLDDAAIGFRHRTASPRWPVDPDAVPAAFDPRWVVVKHGAPHGFGDLWSLLLERCADKLVVIVSADDLRRQGVRLSRGFSWESTVEDLRAELAANPALAPLGVARHLLVTFRSDAVFWMDRDPAGTRCRLVFDPERAEGEWSHSAPAGGAFGFVSCFTASIVHSLCRGADAQPDLLSACKAGLSAIRALRLIGHGPVDAATPGFPFPSIAKEIHAPQHMFASAPLPDQPDHRGDWMLLDSWQSAAPAGTPLYGAATATAISGAGALGGFPVARFGLLQTVDRHEIESLRTLRQLIVDYEHGGRQEKPLNLGVFGPPGAGKSFGIKQIAKAVLGKEVPFLTFNLSQFSSPDEINGALHQVRDKALTGATPVVFWDEFDSQAYRWLQFLLAPMQDGAFQEGPLTHLIGKSVFIFAGATSSTWQDFGPIHPQTVPTEAWQLLDADRRAGIEKLWDDFVLKKGPDFRTRLAGCLNELGPNPRILTNRITGERRVDPADGCYPIRRAFFIRSQFKLKDGQRLEMDRGVLRALLHLPEFKGGARSLETLCQHLRHQGGNTPQRAHLPGDPVLALHVDPPRFWALCERDLEFKRTAEALAPALHQAWLADPGNRGKPADVPWEQLAAPLRFSNVLQARRIADNLDLVGLRLVQGKAFSSDDQRRIGDYLARHMELLADEEHEGWCREKRLHGWRYGPERDNEQRVHPALVPYPKLSEQVKEQDRSAIRQYPALLASVGWKIEFVEREA